MYIAYLRQCILWGPPARFGDLEEGLKPVLVATLTFLSIFEERAKCSKIFTGVGKTASNTSWRASVCHLGEHMPVVIQPFCKGGGAKSLPRETESTVNCRTLETCGPCTAVHTAARPAKIVVGIPREI